MLPHLVHNFRASAVRGLVGLTALAALGPALASFEYRIPIQGLRTAAVVPPGGGDDAPVQVGKLRLSTDTIEFGLVKSGSFSPTRNVVLTNTDPTNPLSVTFTTNAPEESYLVTNHCATSVAPLGSCQVDVVYRPTAMGPSSGGLTFTVDGQAPLTVALAGTGGRSVLSAQDTDGVALYRLTFADTRTNTTSAPRSFALKNSGNWPVLFDAQPLSATAPFSLTGTQCEGELAPGASCSVSATFSPTTTGLHSVPLVIASDAQDVTPMALEGRGIAPNLTTTPSVLNFGTVSVGQTQSLTVALENTGPGSATLSFSSLPAPFAMTEDCPPQLDAGQSCTLTFSITASNADTFADTLTITGGAVERTIGLSANVRQTMQGVVETIRDGGLGSANLRHFEYSPSTRQLYWSDGGSTLKRLHTSYLDASPTNAATSVVTGDDMAVNPVKGVAYFWTNTNIVVHVLGTGTKTTYVSKAPSMYGRMAVSAQGDRLYLYSGSGSTIWAYDLDADGQLLTLSKDVITGTTLYALAHDGQHLWTLRPAVGIEQRKTDDLSLVTTYPFEFSPFGGSVVDMVAGPNGKLFVADRSAVYVVDPETSTITLLAGNSVQGHADGTGTAARFTSILGIAWAEDRLYIWDYGKLRSIR